MKKKYRAIGVMSGSSLDGVDIAYCEFEVEKTASGLFVHDWTLPIAETIPFTERWYSRLLNLPTQNALTFAKTHTYFGHYLGVCINDFIKEHQVKPDFIASHGHTIFHEPYQRLTVQIGDGAALAATTGYTVINNFRNQDIAIDGEGAPVAPIADLYLLKGYDFYLNLGGIANISCKTADKIVAFDICPANQLLNALAQQLQMPYDEGGRIAEQGDIDEILLKNFNQPDYHQQNYPKSLDNVWVEKKLFPFIKNDKEIVPTQMRTSVEYIVFQIVQSIQQIIKRESLKQDHYKLLATGGGVFNHFLMKRLQEECRTHHVEVVIPNEDIIQFKEALLMAWMGVLRLEGVPNTLKDVTGAKQNTIGGAVYAGWKTD